MPIATMTPKNSRAFGIRRRSARRCVHPAGAPAPPGPSCPAANLSSLGTGGAAWHRLHRGTEAHLGRSPFLVIAPFLVILPMLLRRQHRPVTVGGKQHVHLTPMARRHTLRSCNRAHCATSNLPLGVQSKPGRNAAVLGAGTAPALAATIGAVTAACGGSVPVITRVPHARTHGIRTRPSRTTSSSSRWRSGPYTRSHRWLR